MPSRFKLFSDPVGGFVSVPTGRVLGLVETPAFQRLRRIRQLGLGHLVFPGAEHTRFEHALGAMALMQQALATIQEKGTPISPEEHEAALAVALLHDVGHGPFSHTLERELLPPGPDGRPFHHERMSRSLIESLLDEERMDGRPADTLALALQMFDGTYDRPFFNGLVASQLDVDRLDYLRRDSFYTGVAEGVVGVERILKTLRVHPADGGAGSRVVVEAKGAYAIENYLLSRRLMFWQVYLHKTVLAADALLRAAFARARLRWADGPPHDPALAATSPAFAHFLDGRATAATLDLDENDPDRRALLDRFVALDDTDVLYSLKAWAGAADRVLADLARRFLARELFRTHLLPAPPTPADLVRWRAAVAEGLVRAGLSTPAEAEADAHFYVAADVARLDAYRSHGDAICILERDGAVRELSEWSGATDVPASPTSKPYVCLPKEIPVMGEE